MAPEVPFHRSLLLRLLAAFVLIAVCSTAATAWLAVKSTTKAIQRAQGQALTEDTDIYDAMIDYAVTHASWKGAGATVQALAGRTGRQIVLTGKDQTRLAESAGAPSVLPQKASVVVDALQPDPVLQHDTAGRIDPRILGPYRLTPQERAEQVTIAGTIEHCLNSKGLRAKRADAADGRISVEVAGFTVAKLVAGDPCGYRQLSTPVPSQSKALVRLTALVDACLRQQGLPDVTLSRPYPQPDPVLGSGDDSAQARSCLDKERREQLAPYVAPAALLFLLTPSGTAPTRFDLSHANLTRIVGVTALVLAITVALAALIAVRLARPLRTLTAAAQHPEGAFGRVPVTGRGEIGVLASALNDLTDRRERAESQRKAMVSDIAHELRTPLTNIRSWLEATEDGLAGHASDPALTATLLREARQLQHIIDDLQDLATADAGGLPLHPERIRVTGLLGHVAAAHRGIAEAAGVKLTTRITGDPELVADPVRLRQALGNLLSNAVRYTPEGGSVTVRSRTVGGDIEITVEDTGTGIAADDLPHVFERFWRADPSRSRDTGGSGLGLAIVRQITQAHGGTVAATSTPGAGSAFTLRLPR